MTLHKKKWNQFIFGSNSTQNQHQTLFMPTMLLANDTEREEILTNEISRRGRRSLLLRLNFEETVSSSGSSLHGHEIFQIIKNSIVEIREKINNLIPRSHLPQRLEISAQKLNQSVFKILNKEPSVNSYTRRDHRITVLKGAELSIRVFPPYSFFNKASEVLCHGLSGIPTGISSAAIEVFSHSKESSVGHIIMFKVALDLLLQSYQFAFSHSLNVWNGEQTQVSLMSNRFNSVCMSMVQGLSLGLANSDGFWHKSAQKGIQVFLKTLFLFTLFNFFLSEDSTEEKLMTLLTYCSFAMQAKVANQLTHRFLKSGFFGSSKLKVTHGLEQEIRINHAREKAMLG